jgi:hypothetical protein
LKQLAKAGVFNADRTEQRLVDSIVEAAINWHTSSVEDCMSYADILENAIDDLIEFRRQVKVG